MPKIYLSPSNQTANPCKQGDSECDHCNLLCDELVKYLDSCGIEYMRAGRDEKLVSRVKNSNLYKPDIHYCIHTNAGGGARSMLFGYNISDSVWLSAANSLKNRRAEIYSGEIRFSQNRTFYEITATTAKCVYDEVLFHDSNAESAFLHSNFKEIAKKIAQGLCDFFGIAFIDCDASSQNAFDSSEQQSAQADEAASLAARLNSANSVISQIRALANEQ
ncbi:MAG: hypothetical protein ACI4QV_06060 [Acutalibacteraceae bacterium]